MKNLLTYDLLAYKFAVFNAIWEWEQDNAERWAKEKSSDRDQLNKERRELLHQRDIIKADIDKIIAEDAAGATAISGALYQETMRSIERAKETVKSITPEKYAGIIMRDIYTGPVWEDTTIIGLDANGSPNGHASSTTKGTRK